MIKSATIQIGGMTRRYKAFNAKTDCFVEQYSNFTILDPEGKALHVNGKLTLGENIADAGGLSAAFHAWKEVEKKHPSQLLPGLQNFTKNKCSSSPTRASSVVRQGRRGLSI